MVLISYQRRTYNEELIFRMEIDEHMVLLDTLPLIQDQKWNHVWKLLLSEIQELVKPA